MVDWFIVLAWASPKYLHDYIVSLEWFAYYMNGIEGFGFEERRHYLHVLLVHRA